MDANEAEVQALRLIAGSNPICGNGMVKRFGLDPKGGWGFIEVTGSENIIFHGTRGLVPFFSGADNPGLYPWHPKLHLVPQPGNQILYAAEVNPGRGLRAVSWMLWRPAEWRAIADLIEARPLFRMVRRTGPRIQSNLDKRAEWGKTTLWQGKNVLTAPHGRLCESDDEAVYFEQYELENWVRTDYDPRHRMVEMEPQNV